MFFGSVRSGWFPAGLARGGSHPEGSTPSPIPWPSILAAALVALVSGSVLAVRLEGVLARGDLFDPNHAQGPPIYSIWKLRNGFPLYERPDRDYYNVTFYNFLFVAVHGGSRLRVGFGSGTSVV